MTTLKELIDEFEAAAVTAKASPPDHKGPLHWDYSSPYDRHVIKVWREIDRRLTALEASRGAEQRDG